jgi:hypothetical protein
VWARLCSIRFPRLSVWAALLVGSPPVRSGLPNPKSGKAPLLALAVFKALRLQKLAATHERTLSQIVALIIDRYIDEMDKGKAPKLTKED